VPIESDTTTRLGGWLFRHRTALPVPVAAAILLLRAGQAPPSPGLLAAGIVAIPFDQNATSRWGVFADFFSVPASTHPGLARLHALSGAPVYPVVMVRQDGTPQHKIVIGERVETVRSDDTPADTVENTRRFNAVFADIVRRYPDQWIWMHKRWRTRPPGEPSIY